MPAHMFLYLRFPAWMEKVPPRVKGRQRVPWDIDCMSGRIVREVLLDFHVWSLCQCQASAVCSSEYRQYCVRACAAASIEEVERKVGVEEFIKRSWTEHPDINPCSVSCHSSGATPRRTKLAIIRLSGIFNAQAVSSHNA